MSFLVAIDIGAGQSTKVAVCVTPHEIIRESEFPVDRYGGGWESYCKGLIATVECLIAEAGLSRGDMEAIGIATAGILSRDGSFLLVHNIPFLQGHNLCSCLGDHYGVPVGIDNDANAGGLAEWSVLQVELLYWVFGGGWGGAWISREGEVQYPATDWSGDDAELHPTAEPGYSIGLEKIMLRQVFLEVGASFERFEFHLREEYGQDLSHLAGPGGDPDSLRAEMILSGPGRLRLFRAVVGDDDFYTRFLDFDEVAGLENPGEAGRYISKLSSMRVEAAVNTDRLYGKILAHATRSMIKRASADGLAPGVPVCLGGKPSYALPYFGPSTQRFLGKFGLMNYLRPSVIDERGLNANVVGAGVLARKAAEAGSAAPSKGRPEAEFLHKSW
ncbi:ROK family protein [Alkalispirochaeta americana]|uniref:ROK family protein n=1 Tax=Alkalispirochaeta americana TaxID=159291 RepID=A0A1N6UWE4_9SPIO|nr:ROK family protein [Alkalispirochaeta americana]